MSEYSQSIAEQAVTELKTALDFVRWAVSRFNEAGLYYGHGTDNPFDEANSLVLQMLHLPHELPEKLHEQMLSSNLTSEEKQRIVSLVMERVEKRIPLAYLTNLAWFCGRPFYVDERVLVPRSPFAELIDKRFEQWLDQEPMQILDLCTGSGCIAIALAYAFGQAQVDAVDISDDALDVASINVEEHDMSHRVYPIKSDLMKALNGQSYDLIVSNPPYVDEEDMGDLPDEFHHEPELGLAAGLDGLDLVDDILKQAPSHLNDGGWLFVEVGNSLVHMDQKYPGLDVQWIDFDHGGHGVFAVNKETLQSYFK